MPHKRRAAVDLNDEPDWQRQRTQNNEGCIERQAHGRGGACEAQAPGAEAQASVRERTLQGPAGPRRSPERTALRVVTAQVLNCAQLQVPEPGRQHKRFIPANLHIRPATTTFGGAGVHVQKDAHRRARC